MLRLRLASDDVVEREVQSARIELADVAHHALEAQPSAASSRPSALPLGTRQKAARLRFVSRARAG